MNKGGLNSYTERKRTGALSKFLSLLESPARKIIFLKNNFSLLYHFQYHKLLQKQISLSFRAKQVLGLFIILLVCIYALVLVTQQKVNFEYKRS